MRPMIVAHRGSSGSAPENTLSAFQRAVEDGADMIELDVRMTADFELIVIHDRTVRRTTGGRGYVWDLTMSDIRMLDAGAWYGTKFKGERVPVLRQIMNQLPPDIKLNVEVKTDGERRKRIAFEESLILLIRERDFTSRTLVSSFDHGFLKRLHNIDPGISIGALYSPVRDIGKRPSAIVAATGATAFTCSIAQMKKRFADDALGHGISVGCYGVNNGWQCERALQYGVQMIITDYPREMRKYIS